MKRVLIQYLINYRSSVSQMLVMSLIRKCNAYSDYFNIIFSYFLFQKVLILSLFHISVYKQKLRSVLIPMKTSIDQPIRPICNDSINRMSRSKFLLESVQIIISRKDEISDSSSVNFAQQKSSSKSDFMWIKDLFNYHLTVYKIFINSFPRDQYLRW